MDRIIGTIDEMAGRAELQFGEWTGDLGTQAEGTALEIKGKVENAIGKLKDAAREEADSFSAPHESI